LNEKIGLPVADNRVETGVYVVRIELSSLGAAFSKIHQIKLQANKSLFYHSVLQWYRQFLGNFTG